VVAVVGAIVVDVVPVRVMVKDSPGFSPELIAWSRALDPVVVEVDGVRTCSHSPPNPMNSTTMRAVDRRTLRRRDTGRRIDPGISVSLITGCSPERSVPTEC
jgi:hypothetical protein